MTTELDQKMDAFLSQPAFAVAGASTHREKYGNKVVRVYLQHHKTVYPINPRADAIEGVKAVPDVASVPAERFALSIVTPPAITALVVKAALDRGVRHFWMQPGAENLDAVAMAEGLGANVLHSGPCVLVALGYTENDN